MDGTATIDVEYEPGQPKNRTVHSPQAARCYNCFRPKTDCFCDTIPTIDNRTEVLILQHARERFHPFNTARIVHTSLRNSTLLVDQTLRLADAKLPLKPRTGLLYPGPEAALLSNLPADQRPISL
jgi:DTW domain-containing protein YfiP